MENKTKQRREQLANAQWQHWLDAGYNEEVIKWKNYQKREVFWAEYEALIQEAKTSLGDGFKISRAATIHPAIPPLQSPSPASPPVKLSFKGNFSHSLQLPQALREDALKSFFGDFGNQNAVVFFWGLVAYAIGVIILGGNVGNMSNFIWYALGWGGLAGVKYLLKYDEVKSVFEFSSDQITKKSILGNYTLQNDQIKKIEVVEGNIVIHIQDAYRSQGNLTSATVIPNEIEHRNEVEAYLHALVKKNNRTKPTIPKASHKHAKQNIKMYNINSAQVQQQQQRQKNLRKHHQRMHRRK